MGSEDGCVPTIAPGALYTAKEVADRLRCAVSTVYDLAGSDALAVIRIGAGRKGLRFRGSDVNAFLESRREGGPQPRMTFKRLGL